MFSDVNTNSSTPWCTFPFASNCRFSFCVAIGINRPRGWNFCGHFPARCTQPGGLSFSWLGCMLTRRDLFLLLISFILFYLFIVRSTSCFIITIQFHFIIRICFCFVTRIQFSFVTKFNQFHNRLEDELTCVFVYTYTWSYNVPLDVSSQKISLEYHQNLRIYRPSVCECVSHTGWLQ